MISVFLVDDHPLVLRGLSDLFEAHPEFSVVGQESDGLQVMKALKEIRPDVVVLDLMMPNLNGMELIAQVTRRCPNTRVVVLSMHTNAAYVWQALRNGAIGYVPKGSPSEEIITAVREAARGRRYLSPSLPEHEMAVYAYAARQSALDPYEMLTFREKEVLQMSAEGNTSVQIAARLHIGVRTAETHRANLLRKLDLHGQTELVRYAIRRGVVSSE
ncbi:MAG: response regulator transcription factor [Betaproteobacteria bacterium]|nr:response regulator transcription factor [Betaproteobacteria bacterium]